MTFDDFTFEKLGDNIEICISTEHRFGTDAFLLADFAKPRHKDKVCDFCTGSGIVALLMHRDFKPDFIYALEIQKKAHEQLKISLERSGIDTIQPVLCDLKDWKSEQELDLITCNPPYKIDNTGAKNDSDAVSIARHEMMCNIDDVCIAAAKNLRFGGRLCICNRPQRLCDILVAMRAARLEPKRVRFVAKEPTTAPWLVLVEGRKGGNPFLQVEPTLFTQGKDGGYSDEMKRIYKIDNGQQFF
ncbi:MAG: methyltransferase [Ruminococcus sp.]|nr:methyltransferase [Ruminococcus sp.]